ncbi:hypothetical protein EDD80_11419 [Anseongella ginsenosidimutans]|uniref:Uncharacterized protein n=1 Tax=Anseongella ginsenosidimutans TaxID=496056 RepID=A0A4R3KMR3_9SPHI|nr:hypothetical protein [Anseongella ginsenosidimutans]TCS85149.1 hypothetical protein EDD80_11419 [Anseongella ginsenosidimutans]
MKENLRMVLILTFLTTFNSCDQERQGISGESIITGVQNGKGWAAPASGRYNSGMDDTVKIAGWFLADENKAFTENIIFSNILFKPESILWRLRTMIKCLLLTFLPSWAGMFPIAVLTWIQPRGIL